MTQWRVDSDIRTWRGDVLRLEGIPIVEYLTQSTRTRKDARYVRSTLVQDGSNEDGRAKEELSISVRKGRIVRKLPRESSHNRASSIVGKVEECVNVRQDTIPDAHRCPRRFRHASPDVRFLGIRSEDIMIPVEWEESRKLHPAVTQFLVRIAIEAASVDTEHGDTEEGKGEGLWNGEEHVGPEGGIVAAPVAGPFASAGESGTADDEGSLTRNGGEEGVVGCVEDLEAEEVVDVVLFSSIGVGCVRGDCVDGQITLER